MSLAAAFQEFDSLAGATGPGYFEFLAPRFVVGDEELLDLFKKRLAHIGDRFKILMVVGMNSNDIKSDTSNHSY
jgi:hypothetical protein